MRIVVHKYGGSSVADLDRIQQVADRIGRAVASGQRVVAVVSAMGNTTNELIALARQVAPDPDRRELDMLISVGERITMALLAMCLREQGVPARSLTGSQSGIVTDESHADAQVVEVRPARLISVLEAGEVAIVAGFQGVSREREVTTLGRGGSDTTAVVLAAALHAEHAELCSDVDGVWSADPRVVPQAIRRDEMSLSEALALARGGAKVLFEDAVRYARDHQVAIVATTTFGPGAGTRLVPELTRAPQRGATAITGDASLVAVAVAADDEPTLSSILAAGGRPRRRVGGLLHVDVRNVHGGLPGGGVPIAVVTAVGSALGERPLVLLAASRALADVGIEAHGASGDAAWWQVPPERLDDAVRALHAELVDETFPDSASIAADYDRIAAEYTQQFNDELQHKPFDQQLLRAFAGQLSPGPIADLGCGPGHIGAFLHQLGMTEVIGIDRSPGMLEQGRRAHPELRFELGDLLALPLETASVAGLVSFYALMHLPPPQLPQALRELVRVLRPGGRALIALHGRLVPREGVDDLDDTRVVGVDSWYGQPVRIRSALYTPEILEAACERAGFEIDGLQLRPPYDTEHPTQRIYLRLHRP
ncbi:MAG TPA: methyltransferase domain-containing protein [Deltaproteobacteria bacterium]|nr:methyltransferase domain-containing protein [Deltaproteobacteria bacterium]